MKSKINFKSQFIKLVEYALFLVFLLAFFTTLILFDIIQRIGALFGIPGIDFTEYLFNKTLLLTLKITGASFNFECAAPLPKTGPIIIISNHQSMFDIPLLYVGLSQFGPRFVSKKELARGIPGVSTCLRLSQAALIDRKNPAQAIPEIQRFAKYIKEIKKSAVIFPEGTRARDGIIRPFKLKGATTLIEECMPCWVIPVAIKGSWRFQSRKYGPIPFGIKVSLNILSPIEIKESSEINSALAKSENLIRDQVQR